MLQAIQNRLRDLIASAPVLAGYPVLVEDKGNLASEVENALQTQSLAIVVMPSSGQSKGQQLRGRALSEEEFEVVVHRGLLDDPQGLTTVAVIDTIVPLIHGAPTDPTIQKSSLFTFKRHELRENTDGSFCRVLIVATDFTWSPAFSQTNS
jgi:hypothetical protein